MLLATGTYKGLNSIGRAVRSTVKGYGKRIKGVNDAKEARNLKMINENFGSVENYRKLQK